MWHYSRHLRHDVFNAVFTVVMFAALFQYLRAHRLGEEKRAWGWLTVGAGAVALSLTTKEVAFIHGFIGFTFIVMMSVLEGVRSRRRLFWIGLGLLVVGGGVILWLTVGNAGPVPVEGSLNPARRLVEGLAGLSQRVSRNEELEHLEYLDSEDPESFAESMVRIHQRLNAKVLGGCCGTDHRHIRSIARLLEGT